MTAFQFCVLTPSGSRSPIITLDPANGTVDYPAGGTRSNTLATALAAIGPKAGPVEIVVMPFNGQTNSEVILRGTAANIEASVLTLAAAWAGLVPAGT